MANRPRSKARPRDRRGKRLSLEREEQRQSLRARLIKWHDRRYKIITEGDQGEEEPDDWDPPTDPETAWTLWTLLRSIEWKHLPSEGGLLDQDEQLMSDIATIEWLSGLIEPMIKARYGLE